SNSSQKRPAGDSPPEHGRAKRAKYTSAACNECKRCKVKCIRIGEDVNCQRCSSMGLQCIIIPSAAQTAKEADKKSQMLRRDSSYDSSLKAEVLSLRQQMHDLTTMVATLVEKHSSLTHSEHRPTDSQIGSPAYTNSNSHRDDKPKQPQFIGPTRSAFSFSIAETSLANMGIPTNQHQLTDPTSTLSSRESTPERSTQHVSHAPVGTIPDALVRFSALEAVNLVTIYQEEVVCAQPIVDTENLITNVPHLLDMARYQGRARGTPSKLCRKDCHILRLAIATALTHESRGKNDISEQLVETVEQDVGRISSNTEVELKDLQLMGMLSIYFCHTGEELFAWRAIGRAARQALEMGLHRKQSLLNNFKDDNERNYALQIFWVIYQLDRRWSFGTSLSFALNDKDIDPELPEPGADFPYLKCMIAYGRLCSRVWEALPPYGSSSQLIPKEKEDYLDFITQNWVLSIPDNLHFKHPRAAPPAQSRVLQRLRTLLYLRGNYMRLLIHRHHVVSYENVRVDSKMAQLVVDVAKDSIQVLVHFNETSDIYNRQPSVYHYYLLSALAILLLAVCHAPNDFSDTCRESFAAAVDLVRGFSQYGTASRRLWKSIRGLLPALRSLSLRSELNMPRKGQGVTDTSDTNHLALPSGNLIEQPPSLLADTTSDAFGGAWTDNVTDFEANLGDMPDMFDISCDLMNIYDAFGSGASAWQPLPSHMTAESFAAQGTSAWELDEVSRHFQGLL
ncbi:hypothetical protein CC86DRAFT_238380, partial [Ophiobolus disseminans]